MTDCLFLLGLNKGGVSIDQTSEVRETSEVLDQLSRPYTCACTVSVRPTQDANRAQVFIVSHEQTVGESNELAHLLATSHVDGLPGHITGLV